MEQIRLFFSHSSKDNAFGQRLVADLRAHLGDVAVWYDASGGLHGGDAWWSRIVDEITARPIFVVLLSPDALASDWVPREMGIAYWQHVKVGKRLLPLYYRPCEPPADWQLVQSLSFTDELSYEERLTKLLRELSFTGPVTPLLSSTSTPSQTVSVDNPSIPVATTPMQTQSETPRSRLAERLTQEIHAAFGREEWHQVVLRSRTLQQEVPEAMTVSLWKERGLAALALDDGQVALEAFDQALTFDPYEISTLQAKAQALIRLRRLEDAQDVLERAETYTSIDEITVRLSVLADRIAVLRQRQKWDDALAQIEEAERLEPNELFWPVQRLETLLEARRIADAQSLARSLQQRAADLMHPVTEEKQSVARITPASFWIALARTVVAAGDPRAVLPFTREAERLGLDTGTKQSIWTLLTSAFPPGKLVLTYRGYSYHTNAVVWSPDGQRLASAGIGRGQSVQVWDASNGQLLLTHQEPASNAEAIAWSPDGQYLASTHSKTVQVWDANDDQLLFTYRGHVKLVHAVAWSPDGQRIASGSGDNTVQVWDADDGQHLLTFNRHERSVSCVVWSPDGQRIASGGLVESVVQVWDANSGRLLLSYQGHPHGTKSLAWSPDGQHLASAGDDTVQIWNVYNGQLLLTYRGHSGFLRLTYGVAWSPDGQRLASTGSDNTVQVWDADDGHLFFTSKEHTDVVTSVAWSPDGQYLASSSFDSTVQVLFSGKW